MKAEDSSLVFECGLCVIRKRRKKKSNLTVKRPDKLGRSRLTSALLSHLDRMYP